MRRLSPCALRQFSFAQCSLGSIHRATGARCYNSGSNTWIPPRFPDFPRTFFSGIQPTGIPHLGNYFGALHSWVRIQNTLEPGDRMFISIVDLHALTSLATEPDTFDPRVAVKPEPIYLAKRRLLASLLAVGLDPVKIALFYQSEIPEHAELHWILSCNAPVGSLMRMTQWKTKMLEKYPDIKSEDDAAREAFFNSGPSNKDARGLKLGLFSYPVLQAADILLYRTTHVPVGADQVQHVEFARNEADRFNTRFPAPIAELKSERSLRKPSSVIAPFKRVMSLTDPTQKMSKSAIKSKSRILLSDDEATIRRNIMAAMTDSVEGPLTFNPVERPGVANLIRILAHTREARAVKVPTFNDSEAMFHELVSQELPSLSMKDFKTLVADEVEMLIAPMRAEYLRLMEAENRYTLDRAAAIGARRARKIAKRTMDRVKEAVDM